MSTGLFSDKQPHTLLGLPVIISPLCDMTPRMVLSHAARAVVTAEFAAEMDAWMLQRFGVSHEWFFVNGAIVIGPLGLQKLKDAARIYA